MADQEKEGKDEQDQKTSSQEKRNATPKKEQNTVKGDSEQVSPAGSSEQKKHDQAKDLIKQFRENRQQQDKLRKLLEGEKDPTKRNRILGEIGVKGQEVRDLIGKSKGMLSPELQDQIQDEEKKIQEARENNAKIDTEEVLKSAKRLQEQGKTNDNPIAEVAGIVLEERVEQYQEIVRLRERGTGSDSKNAIPENSTEEVDVKNNWLENQDKLAEARNRAQEAKDTNSAEDLAQARQDLSALESEERALINRGLKEDPKMAADEAKFQKFKQDARDQAKVSESIQQWNEVVQEAARDAEANPSPEAARRLHRAQKELENFAKNTLSNDPKVKDYEAFQRKIESARAQLAKDRDDGLISPEEFAERNARLTQQSRQAERQVVQEMGAGGRMYEPMPRPNSGESHEAYEKRLDIWVWQKIKAIDSASISPSALVYSPAYSSLLNALTEIDMPERFKDNINAWRTIYEMGLIWDGSGRAEDVLARASDIDPDAFLGLIGQKVDGKYTEQARLIQKAFAMLDARGYEFTHESKLAKRQEIFKQIADELNNNSSEGLNDLGEVYTRIAYRYWKFTGREGRFDRNIIEYKLRRGERPRAVNVDTVVYREDPTTHKWERTLLHKGDLLQDGDKVTVGEEGDKLAMEKKKDKRYSGYSKTSVKFWYRRLLPGGLRQEKNIYFLPKLFDNISYGVKDYASTSLVKVNRDKLMRGRGITKEQAEQEMRRIYSKEDQGIETIEEWMLENVDWANDTGTFGVWVDDLRKAADTRKELIRPEGLLDRPLNDPRMLSKLYEAFETDSDKRNGAMKGVASGMIEIHKGTFLPRYVEEKVLNPGDDENNPTGISRRLIWSDAQRQTGLGIETWDRNKIEDFINEWVKNGKLSPAAGEELKRQYLGIGILKIPGYWPVRTAIRYGPGIPLGVIGFFVSLVGQFVNEVILKDLTGGGAAPKRR